MAKKQTRRSISVSRTTYERLKSFCETQGISMSQFVENRVGDFLSTDGGDETPATAPRPAPPPRPVAPRPTSLADSQPQKGQGPNRQVTASASVAPSAPRPPTPMTSAAARYAVEPPPPMIKPREHVDAKPPVQPTADQIFTF